MNLQFDVYKKGRYIGVNIWYPTAGDHIRENGREYLTEIQYSEIANWCNRTFNTKENKLRARRMAFADFWFTSKRDLDWFILHWSGVDINAI